MITPELVNRIDFEDHDAEEVEGGDEPYSERPTLDVQGDTTRNHAPIS